MLEPEVPPRLRGTARETVRLPHHAGGGASFPAPPRRPSAIQSAALRPSSTSARTLGRPEQLVLLFADDVDLDLSRRVDTAPLVSSGLRALCEDELDGATISLDDVDD